MIRMIKIKRQIDFMRSCGFEILYIKNKKKIEFYEAMAKMNPSSVIILQRFK